jgi:hypothetical protein
VSGWSHSAAQHRPQLDITAATNCTHKHPHQGLLGRPDWDTARLVPLAHIPAGSGNGLAHSCGLRDAQTAAFAICKGVLSPMDVASVLQPPSSRRFMMLSVAYGGCGGTRGLASLLQPVCIQALLRADMNLESSLR